MMRNIICWGIKPKQMLEVDFNVTPLNYSKRVFNLSLKSKNPENYYWHYISQRANLYSRSSERWSFVNIANRFWRKNLVIG